MSILDQHHDDRVAQQAEAEARADHEQLIENHTATGLRDAATELGGSWWDTSEDAYMDLGDEVTLAEARFIAAASPVVVLALLDELEQLRNRVGGAA